MNVISKSEGKTVAKDLIKDEVSGTAVDDAAYEMLKKACEKSTFESYTICFVCTGNTCRSPMAAAAFNDMEKKGFFRDLFRRGISDEDLLGGDISTENVIKKDCDTDSKTIKEKVRDALLKNSECKIRAVSAGIVPNVGEDISRGAINALLHEGIDSDPENQWMTHKAVAVNRGMIEKCDFVVGISSYHAMALMSMYPEFASKITSMPRDISDPYGGDDETYINCLNEIKDGLKELFS